MSVPSEAYRLVVGGSRPIHPQRLNKIRWRLASRRFDDVLLIRRETPLHQFVKYCICLLHVSRTNYKGPLALRKTPALVEVPSTVIMTPTKV